MPLLGEGMVAAVAVVAVLAVTFPLLALAVTVALEVVFDQNVTVLCARINVLGDNQIAHRELVVNAHIDSGLGVDAFKTPGIMGDNSFSIDIVDPLKAAAVYAVSKVN